MQPGRKVPQSTAVSWDQPLHHQLAQVPVIRQVADVPGAQRRVDPNNMLDRAFAKGSRTMLFENVPPGMRFEGDGAPGSTVGSDEPSKRNAHMKFGSSLSLYENYPPVWSPSGRKALVGDGPGGERGDGGGGIGGFAGAPGRGGGTSPAKRRAAALPKQSPTRGARYSPAVASAAERTGARDFRRLSRVARARAEGCCSPSGTRGGGGGGDGDGSVVGGGRPSGGSSSPGRALSNGYPLTGQLKVPVTPIRAGVRAAPRAGGGLSSPSSPAVAVSLPHEVVAERLDLRARGPKFALHDEPLSYMSASLAHVPDVSTEAHAERAARSAYQMETLEAHSDAFHRRSQWGSGAAEQDAQAIALSAFASVHPMKSALDNGPPACGYSWPRDTRKAHETASQPYVAPYIITTPGPGAYNADDSVTARRCARGWTRGNRRTLARKDTRAAEAGAVPAASEASGHWESGRWVVPRGHGSPSRRAAASPEQAEGVLLLPPFAQTAASSPMRRGATAASPTRSLGSKGLELGGVGGDMLAMTTTLSALDRARGYSARHMTRKEAVRAHMAEAQTRREAEAARKAESASFISELKDFEAHFAKINTGSHVVVYR